MEIDGPFGPLSAETISIDEAAHAVVIIPGSGATDRDGNTAQTYRLLAEGLAKHGISSIRIDKRGLFGSAQAIPHPNKVTIADYAQDARDWANRAAEIAPCVWIAGHSEGGLVAIMAAQSPPRSLCGLILLAVPGRPAGQILLEQLRSNPANRSLMPEIEAAIEELETGNEIDAASLSAALRDFFNPTIQPYLIDLFSHDPARIAKDVRQATLIIQGGADIQVNTRDAKILGSTLENAKTVILVRWNAYVENRRSGGKVRDILRSNITVTP